jgi:hypothetical protein
LLWRLGPFRLLMIEHCRRESRLDMILETASSCRGSFSVNKLIFLNGFPRTPVLTPHQRRTKGRA